MKQTPLYNKHVALGATIVDFGGWAMPVQYTNLIEEHHTTREKAGLFDICHMGEIEVQGKDALKLLQYVMSRDLSQEKIGQLMLAVITNEQGGIIDDLTIYKRAEDRYLVVTNACPKDKDLNHLKKAKEILNLSNVIITDLSDQMGKLDLQGPKSQAILQKFSADDLSQIKFYHFIETQLFDHDAIISRSGYTGEDGFEIYMNVQYMPKLWDELLEIGAPFGLKPIGLGARDTLRLEAGYMLNGNEMDETTSPLEVVYSWVTNLDKNFIGSEAIRKQKQEGLKRKLVGFEMLERGIARHGYKVFKNGREIGIVTSGTLSPTLNKAIGMAFVPIDVAKPDTEIEIQIRNITAKAKIIKLPFYKKKF
ncbi:MAG: glycine cleavage system aminomethyltransferase GcvT [Gammaproteobacteria bacterium]|nr:glycine cleavage system aminomethyltransferase GcvT [Gammaproteobacteria bacterium]